MRSMGHSGKVRCVSAPNRPALDLPPYWKVYGDGMNDATPVRGMRIGQLADRLGVNTKTIRYYESIGLLPAPARRPSGYRVYLEKDAERLAFVRTAQRFGLRLDQIREILAFRDRDERPCDYVLSAARGEVADLDRRIAELQATREELGSLLTRAESEAPTDGGRFCELLEHRVELTKEATA